MNKTILKIGGAALLIGYFAKQKAEQLLNGLSFEPIGIKFNIQSINFISTRFVLQMRVYNKSNVSVPIKTIYGNVLNDQNINIAAFQVQKNLKIPANHYTDFDLDVTADNLEVFKNLFLTILKGQTPKLLVNGNVYTLLGTAKFSLVYDKIDFKNLFVKK